VHKREKTMKEEKKEKKNDLKVITNAVFLFKPTFIP
jgi:hypothetical protein